MNTPAHGVLNLLLLGRAERAAGPVALGAILPDLPMVVFYAWERLVRGVSEATIWSELYFAAHWQDFFDVFNSIPLIGVALLACSLTGVQRGVWLCASMLLHVAFDLPLHHDDAHRHFFPLSDWRFESPLSYWDPGHYGRLFGMAEIAGVAMGGVYAWRTRTGRASRGLLATFVVTYFLFIGFAVVVWL